LVPLFHCSHSLALYCWRGGSSTGKCLQHWMQVAGRCGCAAARRSLTLAQGHYSGTGNRHSSPKMVVLSQKGLLQGPAHTPLRGLAGPLKVEVEDNPLARPRFDHFHSLFSPQPPSRTLPLFLALLPGKYNFSPLGSCRRHRTPFCVSLGVTVMMCVIIVVFVT